MKRIPFNRTCISVALGSALLAACGGGGGPSLPTDPPVAGSGVPDRFDELLERIRDIRASERRMYLRVRERQFAERKRR